MNDEERKMLKEAHEAATRMERFFFATDDPRKKTRAQRLDDILFASRATQSVVKVMLWIIGAVGAAAAAFASLKGLGR